MRLTSAQKDSDIRLPEITVDIERHNNSIHSLTFTAAGGAMVKVVASNSYSGLTVLVPAPPKLVKKFKVSGQVLGIAVDELLDSEYAAKRRADELGEHGVVGVSEVEVPEED